MRSQLIIGVGVLSLLAASAQADPAEIERAVQQAATAGLPADALRSKVNEGRAKRVPEARILQVVNKMVGLLQAERGWLQRAVGPAARGRSKPTRIPPALWVAVAEARLGGVSADALQVLVPGPKAVGMATRRIDALVDLHLRGYKANRRMAQLLFRVPPRHLSGLGRSVDGLRRQTGLTHGEVLDEVGRGLHRQQPLHTVMQQVRLRAGSGQGAGAQGGGGGGAGRGGSGGGGQAGYRGKRR